MKTETESTMHKSVLGATAAVTAALAVVAVVVESSPTSGAICASAGCDAPR